MDEGDRCSVCGGALSPDETTEVCSDCRDKQALKSSHAPSHSEVGSAFAATIVRATGFVPPSPKMLGGHFSQIEVLELLGQGGMGAVYKARQIKLDRLVALKIIHPESAGDPAFRERFNREARTLARLNHPNIVAIHDFGEGEEASVSGENESAAAFYYFVMEYVDGSNLRLMETSLRPQVMISIVRQVCEALQYAHEEGVVHRDIKPENILIDARGRVKIADFGLAKFTSRLQDEISLTGTHQVMGTPRYMAPEQLQGSRAVDHRADIYSLGVVIYELLTGELPLGRFAPPSKIAGVDPHWDRVVLRCLEQSPDRRYPQAEEILSDLEPLMASENQPSKKITQRVPEAHPAPLDASQIDRTKILPSSHVVSPEIRHWVKWPGILLMINGFLGIFPVFGLLISGLVALRVHGEFESPIPGFLYLIFAAVVLLVVGLIVRGGWHLVTLEHYRSALLGSFLGQPAGIWALIVLSRPDVRSAFRQPSQPIGFMNWAFTPLPWMVLLASLGIWVTFQPWARIANTSASPIVWVNAAGFGWWQGMATCFSFGGILLMVAISAGFRPVPLWRPLAVGLLGLGVLAATSHFIVELRNGTLPVQPLLEAASWGMNVEGQRPESINEANVVARIAIGPYLTLAAAVGLFAFLTLDLRHAFQSKYKTDTSREPSRTVTFFRQSE